MMFHALSLALTLAGNINVTNVEYLTQRGAILRNIRQRMSDPGLVPSVSTLTAVLTVIGYEVFNALIGWFGSQLIRNLASCGWI